MTLGTILCLVSFLVYGNQLVAASTTIMEALRSDPDCACFVERFGVQLEAEILELKKVTVILAIDSACRRWLSECGDNPLLLSISIIAGQSLTSEEIAASETPVLTQAQTPVACHTCNGVTLLNGGRVLRETSCNDGHIIVTDTSYCTAGNACLTVNALVQLLNLPILEATIKTDIQLLCNVLDSLKIKPLLSGGTLFMPHHTQYRDFTNNQDNLESLIVPQRIYPEHLKCLTSLLNVRGEVLTITLLSDVKVRISCGATLAVVVNLNLFRATPDSCYYGSDEKTPALLHVPPLGLSLG